MCLTPPVSFQRRPRRNGNSRSGSSLLMLPVPTTRSAAGSDVGPLADRGRRRDARVYPSIGDDGREIPAPIQDGKESCAALCRPLTCRVVQSKWRSLPTGTSSSAGAGKKGGRAGQSDDSRLISSSRRDTSLILWLVTCLLSRTRFETPPGSQCPDGRSKGQGFCTILTWQTCQSYV